MKIIDIAVPGDSRVKEKELEKIEKYQMLREEIGHVWQMNKVTVIPVVIGALGVISDKFERYMEKLEVKIAIEIIQKTALLGTARILRKKKFYLFRETGERILRPLVTCCYPLSKIKEQKNLPDKHV